MELNFQSDVLPQIAVEDVETIHGRMLDIINQRDTEADTQVGSPTYDATRPVAQEIQDIQMLIVDAVGWAIPSLSSGQYLDEHVKDVGLIRRPGARAQGLVTFASLVDLVIPAGTTLSTEAGLEFWTEADAVLTPPAEQPDPDFPEPGTATVSIIALDVGRDYNVSPNTITELPREFQNLVTITQADALTGGLDAESDDELKNRFFARQRNQSGAGNPENYKAWALEVNGVKAAKVFRATPSPGSVTVAIAAQDGVPSPEMVTAVQDNVDSQANVLANNVVVPATALPIDITGVLTLMPDTLLADVQAAYEASVTTYLETLFYHPTDEPVRYSTLYQTLLNTPGVLDVTDFLVNGAVANILATNTDIAVLGEVTLT